MNIFIFAQHVNQYFQFNIKIQHYPSQNPVDILSAKRQINHLQKQTCIRLKKKFPFNQKYNTTQ